MSVLHDHRWLAQVTAEEGQVSYLGRELAIVRGELEEARAEVERVEKRAAAMLLDVGAKWAEAFESVKEEIARCRAALEVYADETRWPSGSQIGGLKPWTIAKEALSLSVEAAHEVATGLTMDQRKEIAQHVWDKCGLELMEIGSRPRAGEAVADE